MLRFVLCAFLCLTHCGAAVADEQLQIGLFDVDASPPIGSPLAYDPTKEVLSPLSCRGIMLIGAGEPIVLCAVDWIGIGNGGHLAFRQALANAAGTSVDRVTVHALHQHDAPWCDFSVDELLMQHGIAYRPFDSGFAREVIRRAAEAVAQASRDLKPVTHVGVSSAEVEKVASNRRILGTDGRVAHVRYTATSDPKLREFPEGVIDPLLRMVTFWNKDQPLVALTYYATHPQSYYRTGKANPDFPGLARNERQQKTDVPHIHFTGAGGNIGAGKYNDGSPDNRQILADRVSRAMAQAWEKSKKSPIRVKDVEWRTAAVALPAATHLNESSLLATLNDSQQPVMKRFVAANQLIWLHRCAADDKIDLSCLALGNEVQILHMPGELFVEYQLEAQRLLPDQFVAMAAYGDYAPAYIGTAIAYGQGGYETGPDASYVAPEVEAVLTEAIAQLLEVDPAKVRPLK